MDIGTYDLDTVAESGVRFSYESMEYSVCMPWTTMNVSAIASNEYSCGLLVLSRGEALNTATPWNLRYVW